MKKSHEKLSRKYAVIVVLGTGLLFSIIGDVYLYMVNNQLISRFEDVKWYAVENVAFSLEALSYLPAHGPLAKEKYSDIGIIEIDNRHLVYHSNFGHEYIQQLILLDPSHKEYLQQINAVFTSCGKFADTLMKLVSENRTSEAIALVDGYRDIVIDLETISSLFTSAYNVKGKIYEHNLEHASQYASQVCASLESVIEDTS